MRLRPTRRDLLTLGALAPIACAAAAPKTLLVLPPLGAPPHDPGPGGFDRPERAAVVAAALEALRFAPAARIEAPEAPLSALLRAHDAAYIARLEALAPREGVVRPSQDVVIGPGTLPAARKAAGGAVAAVEAVMRGEAKNAFVATRPPGHHASPNAAMGFCFFNNCAIAARHAISRGAERVAIVDFDAHHGNGLQQIFWDDANVLYCSTHQMPLFPGTGAASECGAHDTIVNAPLAKGDGGAAFRAAYRARILPRLEDFAPDVILLCAGFDAHKHDPLAGLRLEASDFAELTLRVMEIAARRCGSRIVSLLEGGYRLEDLGRCVSAHVGALMEA